MTLLVIILIVCSAWICQAYPHDMDKAHDHDHHDHDHHDHNHHDHYHDHDHHILDLAANFAASLKLNDISEHSKHFNPSELLSCIPQDQRHNIHEQCDKKNHEHDHDHTPPMAAECVLTTMKALDNVTGLLDVAVLKTQTIEISSLTPEQKMLASTSLESCIESNFTLLDPLQTMFTRFAAAKNVTMDEIFHGLEKYDKRSNPIRVVCCVACALIENGCSSVPIAKKSDLISILVVPVSTNGGVSSEENAALDDDDDKMIKSQA